MSTGTSRLYLGQAAGRAAGIVRLTLEGPGGELSHVDLGSAERQAVAHWLGVPAAVSGPLTLAPTLPQSAWSPAR